LSTKKLPSGDTLTEWFAFSGVRSVRPLPSKTVPDVAINGYISFAFLSPRESRVLNKLLQRFELQPEPYVAGEGYVQETVKVAIKGYVDSRIVALQDYRKAEDVAAHTLKKALDVAVSSERIVRNPVSNQTVRVEVPVPAREVPPVSEAIVRNPPAGRQASSVEPACLWHGTLRTILAKASPPDVLGDSMFRRIAAQLTEELLPQFETAVQSATGIRKWSGIEAIAKQVTARGLVASNGSGAESLMESMAKLRGISHG